MKFLRKSFALVMALVIISSVFTIMPLTSSAATATNTSATTTNDTKYGKCGKNLKWKFSNGVLTLYGKGSLDEPLPDYINGHIKELIVKDGVKGLNWLSVDEKLKKITLGKGITTLDDSAFSNCYGLKEVNLSNNLRVIGDNAFGSCTSLKKINLPNSVKVIGTHAFTGCTNLKNIKLSGNLTTIKDGAFADCTGLTKITLPAKVNKITGNPFLGCDNLKTLNVSKGNKTYTAVNNVLFTKSKKTLVNYLNSKKNTSYTIPNSVVVIAESAFRGNDHIKTIKIPNSVKTIKNFALAQCEKLSNVKLPKNLTNVGFEILYGSKIYNIKSNWNGDALYNGNVLLEVKSSAKKLNIKKGTSVIGSGALGYCKDIKNVTIPEGVKYINDMAFYNCAKTKNITVPKSVKTIGKMAFGYYDDIDWDGCSETAKIKNFKMKVYQNSTAHKYAKKNGLKYSFIK